jgi:hypothetical protein
MTETAAETEIGAATSKDYSNLAQLRQVLRVDISSAGDRGGTKGGHCVLARATKRKKRIRNQAYSILNKTKKQSLDGSVTGGVWRR